MSKSEFALEGLKKLKELRHEESAIRESIKKQEAESSEKISALYSEVRKAGINLYDFIKKHEIFERKDTEIDIGTYHDHYVPAEELLLYGETVALSYQNARDFRDMPDFVLSEERLKRRLLDQKRERRHKIVAELNGKLHEVKKQATELKKKITELDAKIGTISKRKPEFLFRGKLEKLKAERENSNKELELLNEKEIELSEQIQAYEDLHLFVNDEEIREDYELFQKIQKLIDEYHALSRAANEKASSIRYKPEKENKQIEENKKAQTKVLEALLTPELLDELQSYVSSPDADSELVEIATKVLKAGGRGAKKVTI